MKDLKWEREADVIVIGAGTAGLPAAIAAHDKGNAVLILEVWESGSASSLPFIAGGTPFTCTDLQKQAGVEDSPEILTDEAVRISGGRRELWKTIADHNLETYEWLKSIGAKPDQLFLGPGHKIARVIKFKGGGPGLLKLLKGVVEKKGIITLNSYRAEKLIRNDDGRVIGVTAVNAGKKFNFKAMKAVIITTGGFVQNPELIKEYGPEWTELVPIAPPSHRGDGLKMAMAIGAATEGIGLAVCPSMSMCIETKHGVTMNGWGAILIDKNGNRWCDEMADKEGCYTAFYKKLLLMDKSGEHFFIYDDKARQQTPPEVYNKYKEHSANTIEDLAKLLGIDPIALNQTIDDYNSDIKTCGYDKKFGRTKWGLVDLKKPLETINTPPFYAIKCKMSLTSMKGGLKINTKAQVIDVFGNVIPGLYAAGEVIGGLQLIPSHYYTGHMTMNAFVFGRLTGIYAAEEREH